MSLADELGLLILILAMGAQITLRSFLVRYLKLIWIFSVLVILSITLYSTYQQYAAWASGPPGKFLLPPYQGIWYFFSYAGSRIFSPPLIALLAAIVLSRVAEKLNIRYGERFFEREEVQLFALGILLTGYPGFLFYIVFILIFELLFSAYYHFFSSQKRAPLYFAWFPLAIFAILVKNWFFSPNFLALFNL